MSAATELRAAFRAGLVRPTAGLAPGVAQANLIALPRDWAWDMLLYAQRNPKPCPVLDVSDPGSPATVLADGADLRTDLPLYRIWRDGRLVEEVPDATAAWRDDLVAFLIGCSFSFEASMIAAGIDVRHISAGSNVPMFRTSRACRPAGRLHGELVVSMRPIPAEPGRRRGHRSAAASPRCTAPRCTSVIRPGSASPTWASPTSGIRWRSGRARYRSSGPAG